MRNAEGAAMCVFALRVGGPVLPQASCVDRRRLACAWPARSWLANAQAVLASAGTK